MENYRRPNGESNIDKITNELIKYGEPNIIKEIALLFNKIIAEEKIP